MRGSKMKYLLLLLSTLMAGQTFTPNIQLQLPGTGQPAWGTIMNSNMSKIDTAVGNLQNAFQGPWVNTFTYTRGQQVLYNGSLYSSLSPSNLNNQPNLSPLFWSLIFSAGTGTGTVTSVGLTVPGVIFQSPVTGSPINTAGTLALQLNLQNSGLFFAGPTTGVAALPTFRPIVSTDLPTTITSNTTGTASALAANGTNCTAGSYSLGVDAAGNAEGCTPAGTVTSVGITVPGVVFQTPVTGSPITGAGTLALALNTQAANGVFAGPATGAAATPTFRAIVPADVPSLNQTNGFAGLDANKVVGGTGGAETPSAIDNNNVIITINNCTSACGNLYTRSFNIGGVQQFHAGEMVEVSTFGVFSDVATAPTLQIKFYVSGVVTLGTSVAVTPAIATNAPWMCHHFMSVASISGGNYNMEVNGWCVINGVDTHVFNNALVTVPQATAGTLAIQPIWGTAATGNTITIRSAFIRAWN